MRSGSSKSSGEAEGSRGKGQRNAHKAKCSGVEVFTWGSKGSWELRNG
uniref:Uncharacterized protein n=1 Tax=Rhizophora mucronata TaxID=61149 RepID=A0A2P2ITF1_RHIMU